MELTSQDKHLLARIRKGDEAAFLDVYSRYRGPVYRYALRMSGSASTADDVTQEVFLSLIRGVGQFDADRGSLVSWLYGAARRQVFRSLDENPEWPLEETGAGQLPAGDPHPLDGLQLAEQVSLLRQALASLPPHYREAVVLCDLEELDYSAAAEALGCPVGTVRSRLNRARALLCERLSAVRTVS